MLAYNLSENFFKKERRGCARAKGPAHSVDFLALISHIEASSLNCSWLLRADRTTRLDSSLSASSQFLSPERLLYLVYAGQSMHMHVHERPVFKKPPKV